MENSFEEAISNIERDRPMLWFRKQKDRLTAHHPGISETMVDKRILRECGSDLEYAIRIRFIYPCSTDNPLPWKTSLPKQKAGINWYKPPIDNKTSEKPISRPNKPQDRAPLRCHKCGNTSYLDNNFQRKTRINLIEIEKAEDTKETNDVALHESDSAPS
ncbi:hypothetical protein O181_057122 [Austropuccinia psidii MF-1]|uniref:Uncharacterized protein n=1 Tax=Austropuccinia psidii MF-1 TaxID=1389203 RepID=A0A9Q3HV47_9BASI|nr:hypothetical protein [Austropuccinia psidii MF-1]